MSGAAAARTRFASRSLAALFAHRFTWNRVEHLPQEPGRS